MIDDYIVLIAPFGRSVQNMIQLVYDFAGSSGFYRVVADLSRRLERVWMFKESILMMESKKHVAVIMLTLYFSLFTLEAGRARVN